MVLIKDDLTLERLQRVMSFINEGDRGYETIVEAVHTLLERPENIFYRDIGYSRAMWGSKK